MFAQLRKIDVEFLHAFLVRLDPFLLEPLIELSQVSVHRVLATTSRKSTDLTPLALFVP